MVSKTTYLLRRASLRFQGLQNVSSGPFPFILHIVHSSYLLCDKLCKEKVLDVSIFAWLSFLIRLFLVGFYFIRVRPNPFDRPSKEPIRDK